MGDNVGAAEWHKVTAALAELNATIDAVHLDVAVRGWTVTELQREANRPTETTETGK